MIIARVWHFTQHPETNLLGDLSAFIQANKAAPDAAVCKSVFLACLYIMSSDKWTYCNKSDSQLGVFMTEGIFQYV